MSVTDKTGVKRAIRQAGLTQAHVAKHLGRPEQCLSDLCTGRVRLLLSDAIKIAELIGVDTGDMKTLL